MSRSRVFSRDFKLAALSRMEGGVNVSALSRELSVRRKLLYEWRAAFRAGGAEALRGPGRPRKGSVVVGAKSDGRSGAGPSDELAAARRRIAELERKVGQQALEADFFRQA
ncbi:MAG: transposase, partial [bacterium]|nr:transposase [bacterium]